MIVPSKVFLLLMIIISPVLIQSKETWLRKQGSVETPSRELATADVCSIKNSISCNLASNGTACSKFNVISPQCNVSVFYTFNTCNMATQSDFTVIRYSAHIIHADVSQGLFNGTVIPVSSCKVFKQSHILNTCDMKTDFASLYVRGKSSNGTRCEDYLFHWANGLESLTDAPSVMPTKSPVVLNRPTQKPRKPTIRPAAKPSSRPVVSNRVPTRAPLASGQYYFSPTNQLITGSNVCNVQNTVTCTLANGTDCSKLIVQPSSSCYVAVDYTFTACNLAAQTSFNILRYTARVLHVDVSGGTFTDRVLPGGVCQTFRRGHNLNTCDMKTDFGSLYVNGKTQGGTFCGNYLFHWANGLESQSDAPSTKPSIQPSSKPSVKPTAKPTVRPSSRPSASPTTRPSARPTVKPIVKPTAKPTSKPSVKPSGRPISRPSARPSVIPTARPSARPSAKPTVKPTGRPTAKPTSKPSSKPSPKPTSKPSFRPSALPSAKPTARPSSKPTKKPTTRPTAKPSVKPTLKPSVKPTARSSARPSAKPISKPTSRPSSKPSTKPSGKPVALPSARPWAMPTARPSVKPFAKPSSRPIPKTSATPSTRPFVKKPSRRPSKRSVKKTIY